MQNSVCIALPTIRLKIFEIFFILIQIVIYDELNDKNSLILYI